MDDQSPLHLNAQLWIERGNSSIVGAVEVGLLRAVSETGSINKAAKLLGRSYKWAWDTIEAMNSLSDEALVVRETGGKNGGGTRLTEKGKQLIAGFQAMSRAHKAYVNALAEEAASLDPLSLPMLRRIALKTSARNQLFGVIQSIQQKGNNYEVTLQLHGSQQVLVALVTHTSYEKLELAPGKEAIALIKALWVHILPEKGKTETGQNVINGHIYSVNDCDSDSEEVEVCLAFSERGRLYGMACSAERESLSENAEAKAVFDCRSVIVGMPY